MQPGSRLAKARTRLMVDLMFSRKNDIVFFGSGAASDFNIFDASFFCESTKYSYVKLSILSNTHSFTKQKL